jgi:hypothetical protein
MRDIKGFIRDLSDRVGEELWIMFDEIPELNTEDVGLLSYVASNAVKNTLEELFGERI